MRLNQACSENVPTVPMELVIVDSTVPNLVGLAHFSKRPVLKLSESNDPLRRLSECLAGRCVQTLYILVNGGREWIELCGHRIDSDELLKSTEKLSEWEVDNIVLWPCEALAGSQFVACLSRLTGSNVCCSPTLQFLQSGSSTDSNNLNEFFQFSELIELGA